MKNGTHVRLSDGRTGFVCGSGIDGLTIHLAEGRIAHALAKDVTVIPAPVATDPPPQQRTAQHFGPLTSRRPFSASRYRPACP